MDPRVGRISGWALLAGTAAPVTVGLAVGNGLTAVGFGVTALVLCLAVLSRRSVGQHGREVALYWTPYAVLILVAVLPLQWYVLGSAIGGTLKPFHVAAGLLVFTLVVDGGLLVTFRKLATRHKLALISVFYYFFISYVMSALRGAPGTELVRGVSYAVSGLAVSVAFVRFSDTPQMRRVMLAAAPVSVVSFLLFSWQSLSGTNPLAIIAEAISTGNPNIIQYRLLAPLFLSEGLETQASLRHGVFLALLLATYISVAARRHLTVYGAAVKFSVYGGIVASIALVLFSLSRVTILVGVLGIAALFLGSFLRDRGHPRHLVGVIVSAVLFLGASTLGIPRLIWKRFFEETESYGARTSLLGESLDVIPRAALTGVELQIESSHNFVINAWLSGGVLAAIPAVVIMIMTAAAVASALHRYTFNGSSRDLDASIVLIGILPLIRMFTASAGLHLVDWVSLGLLAAWTMNFVGGMPSKGAGWHGGKDRNDVVPGTTHRRPGASLV